MRVNAVLTDDEEQQTYHDSHTDTCVIGQHALIVHNFNRPVNVVGYDTSKGIMTKNCWIFLAAVTYVCPMTGEVFIIEVHQTILKVHLHNNILCPMQMRIYDVKVNDIKKYLTENLTDQTHSIVMHEKWENLLIPLNLHGFIFIFIPGKQLRRSKIIAGIDIKLTCLRWMTLRLRRWKIILGRR